MIEINNLTNFSVDKKIFSTVAKKVLLGENKRNTRLSAGRETLSLAFVGKNEIRKLNKKFRKKDKATDVLSFALNEPGYLGEVVICPEIVAEKKEEILEVFVHGILHLCGYEHEKSEKEAEAMEAKEKYYLSKIKNG